MEYRTVSTKLPINEFTLFRTHCEKKGVAPAYLIRELILRETEITVPHTVAGKNEISYDKHNDSFTWSIELDTGKIFEVLRNVSPSFIENLLAIISLSIEERHTFIQKRKKESVSIPSAILGEK